MLARFVSAIQSNQSAGYMAFTTINACSHIQSDKIALAIIGVGCEKQQRINNSKNVRSNHIKCV